MIDHLQPLRFCAHGVAQGFEPALSGAAVEQREHPHDRILRDKALRDRLTVKFRECAVKISLIECAVTERIQRRLPPCAVIALCFVCGIVVLPLRRHAVKIIAFENLRAVQPDSGSALIAVMRSVISGHEICQPSAQRLRKIFLLQLLPDFAPVMHIASCSFVSALPVRLRQTAAFRRRSSRSPRTV